MNLLHYVIGDLSSLDVKEGKSLILYVLQAVQARSGTGYKTLTTETDYNINDFVCVF
jgi:hypothetical protein